MKIVEQSHVLGPKSQHVRLYDHKGASRRSARKNTQPPKVKSRKTLKYFLLLLFTCPFLFVVLFFFFSFLFFFFFFFFFFLFYSLFCSLSLFFSFASPSLLSSLRFSFLHLASSSSLYFSPSLFRCFKFSCRCLDLFPLLSFLVGSPLGRRSPDSFSSCSYLERI